MDYNTASLPYCKWSKPEAEKTWERGSYDTMAHSLYRRCVQYLAGNFNTVSHRAWLPEEETCLLCKVRFLLNPKSSRSMVSKNVIIIPVILRFNRRLMQCAVNLLHGFQEQSTIPVKVMLIIQFAANVQGKRLNSHNRVTWTKGTLSTTDRLFPKATKVILKAYKYRMATWLQGG